MSWRDRVEVDELEVGEFYWVRIDADPIRASFVALLLGVESSQDDTETVYTFHWGTGAELTGPARSFIFEKAYMPSYSRILWSGKGSTPT